MVLAVCYAFGIEKADRCKPPEAGCVDAVIVLEFLLAVPAVLFRAVRLFIHSEALGEIMATPDDLGVELLKFLISIATVTSNLLQSKLKSN